ncbi:MAG TPA: outer membrane beta-barrel protein [Thermoanaerobaculaceae bacterium]|nr:outer membrane beta-barrel protein [Thermoanaerobaculaceae bacterium]HRS16574.1 outer membrane beta-barrel protein [Thermoanaerobaculaceae bacterium]
MTTTTFRPLLKTTLFVVVAVLVSGVGSALAQVGAVELTPMVGYRWGGTISKEDNPALGYDADLKDSATLGLILDIPVSYHVQIELSADHQRTGLRQGGLFSPADHSFDMDVNYYHVSVLGQWPQRHVTPYVVGGLGVADLRPERAGFSDSRRFSTTLGAGVKVPFSEHVAFRLEARGYWSDTSDGAWEWDDDCGDHHGHCRWDRDEDLMQAQVRVGVSFRF